MPYGNAERMWTYAEYIEEYAKLKERTKELEAEIGEYAGLKVHNQQVERIKELKDYLVEFGDHKCGCLAIATNNKEHCTCGFEQALKGK